MADNSPQRVDTIIIINATAMIGEWLKGAVPTTSQTPVGMQIRGGSMWQRKQLSQQTATLMG